MELHLLSGNALLEQNGVRIPPNRATLTRLRKSYSRAVGNTLIDVTMLEGKNVNLRIMEKEDLPLLAKWNNDPEFGGEYEPLDQRSRFELDKWFSNLQPNEQWFIIEKKDETRIGQIFCKPKGAYYVVGYRILQNERNKGYCTEAVKIMLDYLFLSKSSVRIEAEINPKNTPSLRVLEKAGFTREGTIRKSVFIRGAWHDGVLYSILREEWREPKMLTKT